MNDTEKTKRGRPWIIAAVVAGLLILAVPVIIWAVLLYFVDRSSFELKADADRPQSELSVYARGPLTRLSAPAELVSAPDYGFVDREGEAASLADFRGKVVVVNLWAMWCAPCRTEMPTLATLAAAYEGTDLLVLPINVDSTDDAIADARSFLDVHEPLPFYSDKSFRLPFLFPESGKMPQAILLDRQGRIRATFAGEADWASAEARALVDALLAES